MRKLIRRPGLSFLTCLLCAALLPSAPAYAFRVGDVELTPLFSVEERYDDNITSSESNELDDYITKLSIGLEATAPGKTQELSLKGGVSHEFFSKEDGYDNTSENISLNYKKQMDQYQSLGLQEAFTHAEEPLTFEDEFGQIGVGRRAYYLNRFGLDYTKDVSKQFSMTAGFQSEIYDRSGEGTLDSYLNGINARFDYAFSSATIVSSVVGFSQRNYDPGDDIYSTNVDAVLRKFITKQFYADFMAGISFIKVGGGGDNYTEPRYQITLTDEVSENTRYSWTIQKQQTTSAWVSDVFDQWRTSLDVNHRIYNRLGLHASLFYGEGEYTGVNVKDKFTGMNGRLDYEITPRVTAFLSHTYSNTSSDLSSREYARNITMLGVRGRF